MLDVSYHDPADFITADPARELAPDGAGVVPLARTERASTAIFCLPGGATSAAVRHRTVEESWYVLSGSGSIWASDGREEVIEALRPGASLTIAPGVAFQWRASGDTMLVVLGVTVPPWPLEQEEAERVVGPWRPMVPD